MTKEKQRENKEQKEQNWGAKELKHYHTVQIKHHHVKARSGFRYSRNHGRYSRYPLDLNSCHILQFLSEGRAEISARPSDQILKKQSSRLHEESFSPGWNSARFEWLIAWENFSPTDWVWKMSWLYEIFQPGLKPKSKVNPGRNLSVALVVLAIGIFPRLSIIFSARTEVFSCD